MKKTKVAHPQHMRTAIRVFLWFSLGSILGLFFFVSFIFMYYRQTYQNKIYPGVFVDGTDVGGKPQVDVTSYFAEKNMKIAQAQFVFTHEELSEKVSAQELKLGYDAPLLAEQAYSVGRSKNIPSDMYLITKAYVYGIFLPASYRYNEDTLLTLLEPFKKSVEVEPINAEFTFDDGKVTEFHAHSDGKKIDITKIKKLLDSYTVTLARSQKPQTISITIPVITVKPEMTLEKVNNMGIKELVGRGTSSFVGSIANRVYNISHAANRLNGVLVKPGETFSFAKAVGDISTLTGYKQAYIIQNGRTILGDGGGVCQVSTTLFRAVLNAGLPITERNQHAYRVKYYEQDSSPGVDAAVYVPSVDLKFKNDTANWLLVQTYFNPSAMQLTFDIYGTRDGREVSMTKPVITSQSPAPEPLYQDDPTLPMGTVKQVDWAAAGAKVYFTREVKKDGKVIIQDTFNSNYRPWQAVYLRGTGA